MNISEKSAVGAGLCVLLLLVAAGVALFLSEGFKEKEYEFLENEPFDAENGVEALVREKKRAFSDTYSKLNIIGTVLCILSVIPLFAAMFAEVNDIICTAAVCALLIIAATGCFALVYGGTYYSAMEKLLEEGEYSRENKARKSIIGTVSAIFWLTTVAIFFFYSYGPYGNGQPKYSWFIWAIAGVLYGAIIALIKLIRKK